MKYKKRTLDASQLEVLRREAVRHVDIFRLFKQGALLLDEVDLILHPLKSELNWPLGAKEPLDFTRSSQGDGLRWQIPFHLLDALFFARTGKMSVDFSDSREAMLVLREVRETVHAGCEERVLQATPHYVLLSKKFYDSRLKVLLGRWLLIWLQSKRLRGVEDSLVLDYLMKGRNASDTALAAIRYQPPQPAQPASQPAQPSQTGSQPAGLASQPAVRLASQPASQPASKPANQPAF
jgi:hypothetical protein